MRRLTMTSASPRCTIRNASPTAWPPVAHAVDAAWFGPCSPNLRACACMCVHVHAAGRRHHSAQSERRCWSVGCRQWGCARQHQHLGGGCPGRCCAASCRHKCHAWVRTCEREQLCCLALQGSRYVGTQGGHGSRAAGAGRVWRAPAKPPQAAPDADCACGHVGQDPGDEEGGHAPALALNPHTRHTHRRAGRRLARTRRQARRQAAQHTNPRSAAPRRQTPCLCMVWIVSVTPFVCHFLVSTYTGTHRVGHLPARGPLCVAALQCSAVQCSAEHSSTQA